MQTLTQEARVLELFADLLDYPRPGLAEKARECSRAVAQESAQAAALLAGFARFVDRMPHVTLEEIYTATFELNAMRHPYIGFHMFGEAYQRSVFMLELKDIYRKHGFDQGMELTDHIAVLLRFMAMCPDAAVKAELALDAILPTLEPMMAAPEMDPTTEGEEGPAVVFDVGDDYSRLLQALRFVLQARYGTPTELEVIPLPDQSRLVS